jgi:hypothetical protein
MAKSTICEFTTLSTFDAGSHRPLDRAVQHPITVLSAHRFQITALLTIIGMILGIHLGCVVGQRRLRFVAL